MLQPLIRCMCMYVFATFLVGSSIHVRMSIHSSKQLKVSSTVKHLKLLLVQASHTFTYTVHTNKSRFSCTSETIPGSLAKQKLNFLIWQFGNFPYGLVPIFMLLLIIFCAVVSLHFLQQAMRYHDNNKVIPTYYATFTLGRLFVWLHVMCVV